MIYAAVFLGCFVFGVILASLLRLGTCGVEYGTIWRCRALVGRRGHDHHVWDPIPLDLQLRSGADDLAWRNRAALMAEERIAFSVMNPKAFVLGNLS